MTTRPNGATAREPTPYNQPIARSLRIALMVALAFASLAVALPCHDAMARIANGFRTPSATLLIPTATLLVTLSLYFAAKEAARRDGMRVAAAAALLTGLVSLTLVISPLVR
jgi:hypothetical protein